MNPLLHFWVEFHFHSWPHQKKKRFQNVFSIVYEFAFCYPIVYEENPTEYLFSLSQFLVQLNHLSNKCIADILIRPIPKFYS